MRGPEVIPIKMNRLKLLALCLLLPPFGYAVGPITSGWEGIFTKIVEQVRDGLGWLAIPFAFLQLLDAVLLVLLRKKRTEPQWAWTVHDLTMKFQGYLGVGGSLWGIYGAFIAVKRLVETNPQGDYLAVMAPGLILLAFSSFVALLANAISEASWTLLAPPPDIQEDQEDPVATRLTKLIEQQEKIVERQDRIIALLGEFNSTLKGFTTPGPEDARRLVIPASARQTGWVMPSSRSNGGIR